VSQGRPAHLRARDGALLRGDVVDVRPAGSMVQVRLNVAGWRPAVPGQFAMVRAKESHCFLARALSVHSEAFPAGPDAPARVSFLIAPVGNGTQELTRLVPGDEVSVLGPVGRGFDLDTLVRPVSSPAGPPARLLVVGGGVGVAPFLFLLECLGRVPAADRAAFGEILVLFGFRDELQAAAADLFERAVDDLRAVGVDVRLDVICEDGSLGRAGLVTLLLEEELRREDVVVACGAHAMCEAVWDLCLGAGGAEAWFSLEAGMACGVGSCQGCVVPVAGGGMAKVCRQGPVFRGSEAFGESLHPCLSPEGSGS